MESRRVRETYAAAGVDIDAASKAKELIKKHARSTFRPEVVSEIGLFGGLFELKGYHQPILVSSVDGVGTKLKIACAMGKHDTIGIDLVNHCVNDILSCGAEPLFFLDYIATAKLVPQQVESIVQGIVLACRKVNMALIGGETAEMPGLYSNGDYDLAGFIIGAVEKGSIIDGKRVALGDVLLGLPSSGIHTNGYSMVRKVFGLDSSPAEADSRLETFHPELGRTLGEELLEPHRCYYPLLKPVLPLIEGMAHITGGGLIDNVPRIMPHGLSARFRSKTWTIPPIFSLIQQRGNIEKGEMYRVFNMGIGMVLICSPSDADRIARAVPGVLPIGEVVEKRGREQVSIK